MLVTGIFLCPTSTADGSPTQDLLNRLTIHYNPTPLPPWGLSHRLFRETPNPTDMSQPSPSPNGPERSRTTGPRYLQILSLSHHAPKTHIIITATHGPSQTRAGTPASSNLSAEAGSGEPATIISIPSGPQSEEFTQLILSKFSPLWQQRQVVYVSNGQAFEIGEFRVRIGEVRQGYGGGSQMGRGAVCEVEYNGSGGDEENFQEEWEEGETVIREFWECLGIKGARECFWVPGLTNGERCVRQWCEVLRVRG